MDTNLFLYKNFNSCQKKCLFQVFCALGYGRQLEGGFFLFFTFYVLYPTMLHLPPLRFHCVGGCWDRKTQDCCAFGIGSQTHSNHSAKSHQKIRVHCKKTLTIFPSPARMSLTKLSLAGNNLIITGHGEFG
jgi:hypothetical protein